MMFWQLTIDVNDPSLLAGFGRRHWATAASFRQMGTTAADVLQASPVRFEGEEAIEVSPLFP
jgi:hypothetical protein